MYGWAGKILRVNLDDGSITKEDTSKYLKYTGGIGFGYKVIFDEAPKAGPFDPENRIIFAVGPLTGSLAPSTGRSEVTSISPHVYAPGAKHPLVTRSGFGGYWGAELKFAGYDAIVVQGKAEKPVFISIVNDEVSIRDASDLWGKDTFEAQDMIKAKLDDEKTQIALIGPSGERLVRNLSHPAPHRQRGGPGRVRRGHGVQEPQGHRRARHQTASRSRTRRTSSNTSRVCASSSPARWAPPRSPPAPSAGPRNTSTPRTSTSRPCASTRPRAVRRGSTSTTSSPSPAIRVPRGATPT